MRGVGDVVGEKTGFGTDQDGKKVKSPLENIAVKVKIQEQHI